MCFATSRLHCKHNTGDCDNHPECSKLRSETLKEMICELREMFEGEHPDSREGDRNETARRLFNRMEMVQSRIDKEESVARLKAASTKVEQNMREYVNAVQTHTETRKTNNMGAEAEILLENAKNSLKTALAEFEEANKALA